MTANVFIVALVAYYALFVSGADALRWSDRRTDLVDVPPVSQYGYTVPLQGSPTCVRSSTNCSTTLPAPPAEKSLTYLTLARGINTYTCVDHASGQAPTFESGDTTLWDAAPLLPHIPNEQSFNTLVQQLLEFDYTALKNSSLSCIGAISSVDTEDTFEIFGVGIFAGHTQEIVNAPNDPELNMQWAFITSLDLTWSIYRVETVQGNPPPTCEGQGDHIQRDYAAEYWFYH